jgi:hypothetical protein
MQAQSRECQHQHLPTAVAAAVPGAACACPSQTSGAGAPGAGFCVAWPAAGAGEWHARHAGFAVRGVPLTPRAPASSLTALTPVQVSGWDDGHGLSTYLWPGMRSIPPLPPAIARHTSRWRPNGRARCARALAHAQSQTLPQLTYFAHVHPCPVPPVRVPTCCPNPFVARCLGGPRIAGVPVGRRQCRLNRRRRRRRRTPMPSIVVVVGGGGGARDRDLAWAFVCPCRRQPRTPNTGDPGQLR